MNELKRIVSNKCLQYACKKNSFVLSLIHDLIRIVLYKCLNALVRSMPLKHHMRAYKNNDFTGNLRKHVNEPGSNCADTDSTIKNVVDLWKMRVHVFLVLNNLETLFLEVSSVMSGCIPTS